MAGNHNRIGNGGEPPANAPIRKFPQDLTNFEEELGFSLLEIPSLQEPDPIVEMITGVAICQPVVAVVLSSFEILVKVKVLIRGGRAVMYDHQEYGRFKNQTAREAQWYPIGPPRESAEVYLSELKAGVLELPQERPEAIFVRLRFKYRPGKI